MIFDHRPIRQAGVSGGVLQPQVNTFEHAALTFGNDLARGHGEYRCAFLQTDIDAAMQTAVAVLQARAVVKAFLRAPRRGDRRADMAGWKGRCQTRGADFVI